MSLAHEAYSLGHLVGNYLVKIQTARAGWCLRLLFTMALNAQAQEVKLALILG
jgi:hypothetical protein